MAVNSSTLIATLGSKPQLITLTVDCLRRAGEMLDEVLVVHASTERAETQNAILKLGEEFPKSYSHIKLQYLQLEKNGKPLQKPVNYGKSRMTDWRKGYRMVGDFGCFDRLSTSLRLTTLRHGERKSNRQCKFWVDD